VLTPELTEDASASAFASYGCEFERAGDVGLLHRLLSLNLLTYLQDDLLVKTDWMPMSNSLEAGSPFADTVLLEDLGALPPWMKATPFGLKRMLPSALRYRLSRRILHRRKHEFGVPAGRWFGGELRGPFEERVLDPGAPTRETLQRGAAGALLDQHLSSKVDPGPR
jgi:asparagine synthetase B (glutamine-hydrolysing)